MEPEIAGESRIKCGCGCEILSTPMPVGKVNYLAGRSLITRQPDIQILDAELAFICTACGKFVYLKEKAEDKNESENNA